MQIDANGWEQIDATSEGRIQTKEANPRRR
jgi:hypothetical protein